MTSADGASAVERARRAGAPIADRGGVTWVWLGADPPLLAGDWCDWDTRRGLRWVPAGVDAWTARLATPPDAYLEYAFFTTHDDAARVPDPLNPARIPNGIGQVNHQVWLPDAPRPVRRRRLRGWPARHVVETGHRATSATRTVDLYRPDVPPGPLPLLVAWDGQDFRSRAPLAAIVDELVDAGRMRPVALARVSSAKGRTRMVEYAANDLTLSLVTDVVMPLARRELELTDPADPHGAWGIVGASMGGLMALYAGLRRPDLFRRVLALSGAFEIDGRDLVTTTLVDHLAPPHVRVWMRSGDYEWLAEPGDRMAERLRRRGYDVNGGRYAAGHNYTAWAQVLPEGLSWLFPPV